MASTQRRPRGAHAPRRVQAVLNVLLVVLLLFQMTRQFLPGAVHEAAGIGFAALLVAHNVAMRRWYAGLLRGRWSVRRALGALVNLALVIVFVGVAACGLGMSGIAVSLGVASHTMQLRSAHIALTHLGFLLVGVHLGLHGLPAVRKAGRALGRRAGSAGGAGQAGAAGRAGSGAQAAGHASWAARAAGLAGGGVQAAARPAELALAVLVAAYGAFAFAKLDFAGYISMQTRFAFIDPNQSVALFVLDHIAVLALASLVGLALAALAAATKQLPGTTKG